MPGTSRRGGSGTSSAYAHKVFAACDALYDYDGIGVWLDADCVTYKPIPAYLIPAELDDAYLAHYFRQGMYTETGLWLMNCAHPEHRNFLDSLAGVVLHGGVQAAAAVPRLLHFRRDAAQLRPSQPDQDAEPVGRVREGHASTGEVGAWGSISITQGTAQGYGDLTGKRAQEGRSMRYDQLIDAVRKKHPQAILEVGTWNGGRALDMLQVAPLARYYGFDLFEDADKETDAVEFNVKRHARLADVSKILKDYDAHLFKGNTRETLKEFA